MEEIYTQWRISLKPKQKKRTYKHFDAPLDLDNEKDFGRVVSTLKNIRTHQFLPLVKFVKKDVRYRRDKNRIVKRTKKERPIMYASHLDAHIYGFYANQWAKRYEDFVKQKNIGDNAIAYRKIVGETDNQRGKNNIAFAQEVFEHIQDTGTCSVIIADISKFFDTLNHKILKEQVAMILGNRLSDEEYKVLRSLTLFRYVLNDSRQKKKPSTYIKFISRIARKIKQDDCSLAQAVYESGRTGVIKDNRTTVGIPQGSPLSGLLANIYMSLFDAEFVKKFPNTLYRRYSDDIAIVCSVSETESVFPFLLEAIKLYALDINPSKAFVATFRKEGTGFVLCTEVKSGDGKVLGKKFIDYLGFEFDGRTVRVRGKTLKNTYRKADKKIRKFYARQTAKNPRKKHDVVKHFGIKNNGAYIKNARRVMETVGQGIGSQQRKLSSFIRRKKIVTKQP